MSEEAYIKAAEKIRNLLKVSPRISLIKEIIYAALISRSTEEAYAEIALLVRAKESDYLSRIVNLNFTYSKPAVGVTQFVIIVPKVPKQSLQKIGLYDIQYKEYFTFYPTSKDFESAYEEVIKFLVLMPKLERELVNLCLTRKDEIKFKFPYLLKILFETTESLVIYYSNSVNSRSIRDIVEKLFRKHGLLVRERKTRSVSGFDLKIGDYSKTHSGLISEVIAREVFTNKDLLVTYDNTQLVLWLKNRVKKVSRWPPEQIHNAISS